MAIAGASIEWRALVGRAIEGEFDLSELLDETSACALFRVAAHHEPDLPLIGFLFPADGVEARTLFGRWIRALDFEGPSLGKPLRVGRLEAQDIVYILTETPDETLADVLRERALDVDEAREVLRVLVSGLGELHRSGSVHGALSPEQVFAVGSSIKLWCAGVLGQRRYVPPEGAKPTVQADVWGLGATLFEVLTGKEYRPEAREEVANLAEPLGEIVRRCLDPDPKARITLAEAAALERGEPITRKDEPTAAKPWQVRARAQRSALSAPPVWIYAVLVLELVLISALWAGEWKARVIADKPQGRQAAAPDISLH